MVGHQELALYPTLRVVEPLPQLFVSIVVKGRAGMVLKAPGLAGEQVQVWYLLQIHL